MAFSRPLKNAAPAKARAQYLFNVDEYHQLIEVGILGPEDRIELIHGELTMMPPIGPEHSSYTRRLTNLLPRKLPDNVVLQMNEPVTIAPGSEPQPDAAIVKAKPDNYRKAHPTPKDVLLIIEVADSSSNFDNKVKGKLYGKAGIPEYWIIETAENLVRVFTDPSKEGYRTIREFHRGDKVKCGTVPQLQLTVDDLLV